MTMNFTDGLNTLWNNFDFLGIGNEILAYILITIFILAAQNMAMKDRITIAAALNAGLIIGGLITTSTMTIVILIGISVWAIILHLGEN